ncbi:ArsR/SmtB family transcription factor [Aquicoccus porphyridii]|uniref:ArsR/SmtB family transcription factor n=1 Tax=Aquicoccus porphyridii TaxID=1852029 RepID=UPI00273F0182|nr:metalloregulator ArsR/SmtB family transcription factor [Aquicoccus porphyridii]
MLNRNDLVSSPADKTEQVAALAKALAHPARVRIIAFLLSRPGCIGGDIVDQVGLAQSTVSEHLRILKEAGIVQGRIDYPRICYSLDPAALAPLQTLLESIAAKPPESENSFCYTPEGYVPKETAQ